MQEVTTADLDWLRSLKDNSGGSCGDGSFDNKERYAHNVRVDRLLAALEASQITVDYNNTLGDMAKPIYEAMKWALKYVQPSELPSWVTNSNSAPQQYARYVALNLYKAWTSTVRYVPPEERDAAPESLPLPTIKNIDSVHCVSQRVYDAMLWAAQNRELGAPPPWVHGGNSHAQAEATRVAHTIIERVMKTRGAPRPPVPFDAEVRATFVKDVKSVLKASGSNYDMAAECVANLAAQIDRQTLDGREEPTATDDKSVTFDNRKHPLRIALQEALVNSPALRNLATREQVALFKSDIVTDLLAVWQTEDDYISLLLALEEHGVPIPERLRPSHGGGPTDYTNVLTSLEKKGIPIRPEMFKAAAPIEAFTPVCAAPNADTLLNVEIGKLVQSELAAMLGSEIRVEVMKYHTLNRIFLRAKSRVGAAKVEAEMVANLERELKVNKRKPWREVLLNLNADIMTFIRGVEDAKFYGGPTMLPKSPITQENALDISTAIADMLIEFDNLYDERCTREDTIGLEQEPKYRFSGGCVYNRYSGEMIPLDEPVFLFRARDQYAALALKGYAAALSVDARGNKEHIEAVDKRIYDFDVFALKHPTRMKVPDTETVSKTNPAGYVCKARADNNGVCPYPNVHCAYPACEERA